MPENGLYGICLLAVCFLFRPGLAQVPEQVPEPAQCLVSGIYNLTRLPESKHDQSCYRDCVEEPDCHMAVLAKPVSGPSQCLLVNCLSQGQHLYLRDPSAQISVYPKSTLSNEQRAYLSTSLRAGDDETSRCNNIVTDSSCQSGIPKFFYNSTSYRCEQFYTGCGSNRNTFDTQEACEVLCSQKFLCYRPMEHGQRPPFRVDIVSEEYDDSIYNKIFYNVSSSKCEGFHFRGSASNGNIFNTVEECESLCAGVKDLKVAAPSDGPVPMSVQPAVNPAPTTGPPAVASDTTVAAHTEGAVPMSVQPAVNPAPTTGPPAVASDTTVAAHTEGAVPMSVQPAVNPAPTTGPPAVASDTTVAAHTEGAVPTTIQPAVNPAPTTGPPAVASDTTVAAHTEGPVVLICFFGLVILLIIAAIVRKCNRQSPHPSPYRYRKLSDPDPARVYLVES